MKAENKIFRIAVLILGYIFYYIFFVVFYNRFNKSFEFFTGPDFRYSYVSGFFRDVLDNLFNKRVSSEIQSFIEFIVIFSIHAGYLYCLWFYREDIAVFIKNFFKKI